MSTLMKKRTMSRQSGSMNKRLKRMERKIAANTPELKHKQTVLTGSGSDAYDFVVSSVAQGDDHNERQGNRTRIKKLSLQLSGTNQSITAARLVVYVPKDPSDNIISSLYGVIDLTKVWVLYDSLKAREGADLGPVFQWKHSFGTLGMIEQYDGTNANSTVKNPIKIRVFTNSGTHPIDGHATCWYTDA